MFNFLKKILPVTAFKTNEEFEEINPKKQELVNVQVRDIKQYLVEEYDRSQMLYENNEYLKKELENAKNIKTKYDASLVMLDKNKSRIDMLEKRIKRKRKRKAKFKK